MAKEDLTIRRGTTWAKGLRPRINRQPCLGPGWVVRAQVRSAPGRPVLHEWSTLLGNVAIDSQQVAVLSMTPAQSRALTFTAGFYDLDATSPTGAEYTFVAGASVRILPELTV